MRHPPIVEGADRPALPWKVSAPRVQRSLSRNSTGPVDQLAWVVGSSSILRGAALTWFETSREDAFGTIGVGAPLTCKKEPPIGNEPKRHSAETAGYRSGRQHSTCSFRSDCHSERTSFWLLRSQSNSIGANNIMPVAAATKSRVR
jgi:hypothetical protein